MKSQSEHMKNGDQKPESNKDPGKALPSFPMALSLKNLHQAHRHNDQRPEMRDRFSNVDDVEIIEKEYEPECDQNDT